MPADWELDSIIRHAAGAHPGKRLQKLPAERTFLPPYSPELNPADRILQEIRRRVEGRGYAILEAKQATVEAHLQELAAEPERVKGLCGWDWILDAVQVLPAHASGVTQE